MTPKRVMWVDEKHIDHHVVELRTFFLCLSFPPSLSLSFFLFLFLVLFFKLPARQLKDPITLYNIPVSQIYCSSLPDVQKVK